MIPWFEWHTFFLGPIPIQVWGFWVALGIVVANSILVRRTHKLGVDQKYVSRLFLWSLVCAFVGARLFHVVFYEPAFFVAHPTELLKIWHGGLSSYGGFVGAVVGFLWFKRSQGIQWLRGVALPKFIDDLFFGAVFGWMIGRVGCFFIHDHLGAHSDCFLALRHPDGARLDMALLEILSLIPLALWLFFSRRKKREEGMYTAVILVYYGVTRFILDFWRAQDIIHADARYFGLTPAQYLSLVMVGVGVWTWVRRVKSGWYKG